MSEKEEKSFFFKKTNTCFIKFDKDGTLTILGNCDGQKIEPVELSGLAHIRDLKMNDEN